MLGNCVLPYARKMLVCQWKPHKTQRKWKMWVYYWKNETVFHFMLYIFPASQPPHTYTQIFYFYKMQTSYPNPINTEHAANHVDIMQGQRIHQKNRDKSLIWMPDTIWCILSLKELKDMTSHEMKRSKQICSCQNYLPPRYTFDNGIFCQCRTLASFTWRNLKTLPVLKALYEWDTRSPAKQVFNKRFLWKAAISQYMWEVEMQGMKKA